MKTIYLISCVSKKLEEASVASSLYISPLFKKNLEYARLLGGKDEDIFILSAKYGLVPLDTIIEPYNKTLNNMSNVEKKEWALDIMEDLKYVVGLENMEDTTFVFLAGLNYRKFLVRDLPSVIVPMEGLPIGKQLQFLTKEIERLTKKASGI